MARGFEVLNDLSAASAGDFALPVVKVRDPARVPEAVADGLSVVTRQDGENATLDPAAAIEGAFAFRSAFADIGAIDRWIGHIPASEPNNLATPGATQDPALYADRLITLTAHLKEWMAATGIRVNWILPPLQPWGNEGPLITAVRASGVLGASLDWPQFGNPPVWAFIGAHNYWNSSWELQRVRYDFYAYWYCAHLSGSAGDRPVIIAECNSNPPAKGGRYGGGYGDEGRFLDLRRFVGLVEGNGRWDSGRRTAHIIAFAHTAISSPDNWRDFDFTDEQWHDFAWFSPCRG